MDQVQSHLGKGVSAVASFLFRVLLVDDVTACGHRPVQKGFLHHVCLSREQFCYDRHNLAILNEWRVTVYYKL